MDLAFQFVHAGVPFAVGCSDSNPTPAAEASTAFVIQFYSLLAQKLQQQQQEDAAAPTTTAATTQPSFTEAWDSAFAAAEQWEGSTHSAAASPSSKNQTTPAEPRPLPVNLTAARLLPRPLDANDKNRRGEGGDDDADKGGGGDDYGEDDDNDGAALAVGGFLSKRYIERARAVHGLKRLLFRRTPNAPSCLWLVAGTHQQQAAEPCQEIARYLW